MALISPLPQPSYPKSNLYLKEGCYGSKLHLRLNPKTHCCDGTYMPPTPMTELDVVQSSLDEAMGHAVLFGHLEKESDTGEYLIKGEWRHVEGPLHGGAFQMRLHENGIGNGCWWSGDTEESTPWEWNPELEPLTQAKGEEHVIQTKKTSLFSMRSMNSSFLDRSLSIRPSLSKRLDRNKTFFDELLASEGSTSVWIARWGVLCAWIFFYQTLLALIMASLQVTEEYSYVVQCLFQAVYTSTYMSFLFIYARMKAKPPLDYVMGVLLYTIGYACFLALYVVVLAVEDADVVAQVSGKLYLSGSLLFLVGSVSLVHATLPPPITMVFHTLSWFQQARLRFAMIDQQSSLFWGSVTFLIGSCCFSVDSAWGLWDPESKPSELSAVSAVAGYLVFTAGRLYFLWGSTTSECNAVFLKKGSNGWADYVRALISGFFKHFLVCRASKVSPSDGSTDKNWLDVCVA